MSRDWNRDDPVKDAQDHANRDMPSIGVCEHCGKAIYSWEDHYDMDGVLLHYDCEFEYMKKFLKIQ